VHLTVVPGGSAPGRRPKRTVGVVVSLAVVSSIVLGSVFSGQAGIQRSTLERRIGGLRTDLAELELAMMEALTPWAIAERAHQLGLTLPDEVGVVDPERPRRRDR
jgi:hypothetical protein